MGTWLGQSRKSARCQCHCPQRVVFVFLFVFLLVSTWPCATRVSHVVYHDWAGGSAVTYDVGSRLLSLFEVDSPDGSFFDHLHPDMLEQFTRFCSFPDVVDRHSNLHNRADGMHGALVRECATGTVGVVMRCSRPTCSLTLSLSRWTQAVFNEALEKSLKKEKVDWLQHLNVRFVVGRGARAVVAIISFACKSMRVGCCCCG